MKIVDLFDGIESLDTGSADAFLASWKTYIGDGDLAALCLDDASGYDFERECMPVIRAAIEDREALNAAHESFLACAEGVLERYRELFGEADVTVVFYLGLCSGAGWVTTLRGGRHILLGAEKIVELHWESPEKMFPLLAHELGHVAQFDLREGWRERYDDVNERSVHQLFTEGFAECVSTLLGPYPNSRGEEWESWCGEHLREIKGEFLRFLAGRRRTQPFFGDWQEILGHSDLGYYLGRRFVAALREKYDLFAIAKLPLREVERALREYLDT